MRGLNKHEPFKSIGRTPSQLSGRLPRARTPIDLWSGACLRQAPFTTLHVQDVEPLTVAVWPHFSKFTGKNRANFVFLGGPGYSLKQEQLKMFIYLFNKNILCRSRKFCTRVDWFWPILTDLDRLERFCNLISFLLCDYVRFYDILWKFRMSGVDC